MKTTIKLFAIAVLGCLAFTAATLAFATSLKADINRQLAADKPSEGIGRVYAEDVPRYAGGTQASEGTALRVFCETDDPLPDWFRPEDADIVWQAEPVKDIASPDWNLNTSLVGWDGHLAEVWEFELFVKITYLEFWGCSYECCEAGADSILRLWESGYFGNTLGETLTARAEDGSLVYSPYAYVWDWQYDEVGLAEIRALCEDRFYNGPTWIAPFFRLWYYHSWATPAYEIDGVYFSVPRG